MLIKFDNAYSVWQYTVWCSTWGPVDATCLARVEWRPLALISFGYQRRFCVWLYVCGSLTSPTVSTLCLSKGCWRPPTVTSLNDHERPCVIYWNFGNQRISTCSQHILHRWQFGQILLLHWRYRIGIPKEDRKSKGNSTRSSLLSICPQLTLICSMYSDHLEPLHHFPPSSLYMTYSKFVPDMTDVPTAPIEPSWNRFPTQASNL